MSNHFYALIMAGGVGSRLWPLSRKKSPKQVLPLVGERSMFQGAVDRLQRLQLLDPARRSFRLWDPEHAPEALRTAVRRARLAFEESSEATSPARPIVIQPTAPPKTKAAGAIPSAR